MNARKKLLSVLLAVVLLLGFFTSTASAHGVLVKSDPPANAVLSAAPARVRLWFNESVSPSFSEIQVLDKDGRRVDKSDLQRDANDAKQISVTLAPLGEGSYTVAWKVLSEDDGHVTRGAFVFSVGKASGNAPPPIALTPSATESAPISVAVRGLNLLTLLALIGEIFFYIILLEPSLRAIGASIAATTQSWSRLVFATIVLALLSAVFGLGVQASAVADVPLSDALAVQRLSAVLFGTRFGILWLARLAFLAAVFIALTIENARVRQIAMAIFALPLLAAFSLGGHSAAAQGSVSLAVLLDGLHLIAVSLWVGGLLTLLWARLTIYRALAPIERSRWIAWMVPRFSQVAIVSVVVIASTGLYNSTVQVPNFAALVQTDYGRALSSKVVAFALMLVFGAINFRILSPLLRASANDPARSARVVTRFGFTLAAEVLLGISAVALAGFLTATPPARVALAEPSPIAAQNPQGAVSQMYYLVDNAAGDVRVALRIKPSLETANEFEVSVTAPQTAQTSAEIQRVTLRFTHLESDLAPISTIAETGNDGRYIASGNFLSLNGMWRIQVVVRRKGVEDVSAEFGVYRAPTAAVVAESDPTALDLLKRSEVEMNRLQTLRSIQKLNDGRNGMVETRFEYRAPDRMRLQIVGQGESIAVGGAQYFKEIGRDQWEVRTRVEPLRFPSFDFATQAKRVTLGRQEILDGEPTQIVRFVLESATSTTQLAYWVATRDTRVRQFAMFAPGHSMMEYYRDYDAPDIAITPPTNVIAPSPKENTTPSSSSQRTQGPLTGDLQTDVAVALLVSGILTATFIADLPRLRKFRRAIIALGIGLGVVAILLFVVAVNAAAEAIRQQPIDASAATPGRAVYAQNCAACHGDRALGDGPAGASLAVKPLDLTVHALQHDEAYLIVAIASGRGAMPAFRGKLTTEQIFQVTSFIRQLARDAQSANTPSQR